MKSEPFSQEIDQIETYLNPANPQYEKALLLANQYVDGATGEQKEKLEQQFSAAVEDFEDK